MAELTTHVELRVKMRPRQDPAALETAIAAEGRRAARQLYLTAIESLDQEAVSSAPGSRQRRETRWVATLFGRVRIARYRVKHRERSWHPLDEVLDLRRGEATRAIQQVVIGLSDRLSYRDIARVITELTGEGFTYQHVSRLVHEEETD
jgi:hypothetical protein